MKKKKEIYCLFLSAVWLCGCHVYYRGFIINNTQDTLLVTTKPSLLSFEKDSAWQKLSAVNLTKNDSVFSCQLMPFDTLGFNSGPSYSSAIGLISFLKIERNGKDSIILSSNEEIRKRIVVFNRRFINRVSIGMKVTDSFFYKPA